MGAYRVQRVDQGQDFEIPIDNWITSPGNGEIVDHASDAAFPSGFGSPYAVVRIDDGPFGGATYYVGHCNKDVRAVGTKLAPGDHIARANNSLNSGWGWCELGLWPPGAMGNGFAIDQLFHPVQIGKSFKPLHKGSKGPRVVHFTRRLAYIRRKSGAPFLKHWFWHFKNDVVEGVRAFQHEQGLEVDGTIGPDTAKAIQTVFERQFENRKPKSK